MKKTKLITLLAVDTMAIGSAFVTSGHLRLTTFYYDDGGVMKKQVNGSCQPIGSFCSYTLNSGAPDDGNPIHYTGVPETANEHWLPR